MGRCDTAPVLEIGHNHIDFASLEKVEEAIAADDTHPRITEYQDLAAYKADGGYKKLESLRLDGDWEDVQDLVNQSGLRGLMVLDFHRERNGVLCGLLKGLVILR